MALTQNYTLYHLHSDLSNAVTNIDSTTKYQQYVEAAKNCGMQALAFSEHGSAFEWYHKKAAIEAAGMKYIHAVEAYLTFDLTQKVRDNYHVVLLAKNYAGFLELNRLISQSFNRNDNHFYYVPRIGFDELIHTSDNIILTTACVGGVFGKGDDTVREAFLSFLIKNKHRCFLEIGHHPDAKQVQYNKQLLSIAEKHGLALIAGTDTHVLDAQHEKGRSILQASKNILFEGESGWDLRFKTYSELLTAYETQGSLPASVYTEAIENTNRLADMVEPFSLDKSTKYPRIYDNPEETFQSKIENALSSHPYALKNHTREELDSVIRQEFDAYKATGAIDFMLLQTYLREWEQKHDIQCGYGRGSVSGSMIAYLLGITQMDSMRFGLNFFRFINPSRVTNADIDTDYAGKDRQTVKEFLLRDKLDLSGISCAEIITFNTIAMKGAIRDVCRALYKDVPGENYLEIANTICSQVESHEDKMRKKYPDVFAYVDIVNGTIVSIGTHPSGVLVSDLPIEETIGLCSVATSEYPVSMVNMKELDDLMYVKLDILGLDGIGVINETCKMLGIERLTPDNTDLEDPAVWESIRNDTTLIFQWESASAQQYMKKFMSPQTIAIAKEKIPNFSMLKWMSFGNGLLRPACASFRDSVADGEFYDNGFEALNEFLAPEAGRIAMQETIMQFLVKFCGYTAAESDTVRRAIAKKKGTETLLPEIEERFVAYCAAHYQMSLEESTNIIKPFLQIILDASAYGFSWNHSDAYSAIGYICGYLRHYHPLEFLTAALNIFGSDLDKTADIIKYANRIGVRVTPPKWGFSRSDYYFDNDRKIISKGLGSVKYMSVGLADELYALSKSRQYKSFIDLLRDLDSATSINARQLDILIKIDFFSEFGNQRELLYLVDLFANDFKRGSAKQIRRSAVEGTPLEPIVKKYAIGVTKSGGLAKSYTLLDVSSILYEVESAVYAAGLKDLSDAQKMKNFHDAMGYAGYVSGKNEDRRKLYISKIEPIHRKSDKKQFGYSVFTKSIGSGKESRFTLFNKLYKAMPIRAGDIILCLGYQQDGQYFTLTNYKKLIEEDS